MFCIVGKMALRRVGGLTERTLALCCPLRLTARFLPRPPRQALDPVLLDPSPLNPLVEFFFTTDTILTMDLPISHLIP